MPQILKQTLEKIKALELDKTSLDELINFYQHQVIILFHKAILEGDFYNESAYKLLTQINASIFSYNESAAESGRQDLSLLGDHFKSLSENYLPKLLELARAIKESVENLAEIKDGHLKDTKELQYYYHLKIIASAIKLEEEKKTGINKLSIFEINLLLAYIDDYLECSYKVRNQLIEVITFLKNEKDFKTDADRDKDFENKTIIIKLIGKAEFLLYKIDYRNLKNKGTHNAQSLGKKTTPDFTQFYNEIELHYNSNNHPSQWDTEIKSFNPNLIREIKLKPFHHLNRYYRKQKNSTKLTELLDKLNELYPKAIKDLPLYDRNSFNSVYKLVTNSIFQLSLERYKENNFKTVFDSLGAFVKSYPIDIKSNLTELKEQIDSEFHNHKYPDYYGYLLLIRFLNSVIIGLIQKPTCLITEEIYKLDSDPKQREIRVQKIIDHIEVIYRTSLEALEKNLDLMITHRVKPISLTLEESVDECEWPQAAGKDTKGKLFLDSSYILPINFLIIRQELDSTRLTLNQQLSFLKKSFDIEVSRIQLGLNKDEFDDKIKTETTKISDEAKKISDDLKRNEFRAVSIIAMFVSITTFVLINVKIFDNKTALESFGIILGIASCLVLFNLFFYVTSVLQLKDSEDAKTFVKRFWPILVIVLVFLGTSLFLLHFEKGEEHKTFIEIEKKIEKNSEGIKGLDSIQNLLYRNQKLQEVFIDSIIIKRGTIINNTNYKKTNVSRRN